MKELIVATRFLTRIPTPRVAVSDSDFAASMRWFPAVGLMIGVIVAAAGWAGTLLGPWIGALAALLLWVGVTGALHLDGLGDVADALGAAHKDRAAMLAAMRDPHVGSFAVVAIVLHLATKLLLLHALIQAGAFVAVALIPFAARIGPLVWARWLPERHHGLGSRFRQAVHPIDLALWTAALLAAAWWSPSLLAAPLAILGFGLWLRRRLGGISGDGHGAGIERCESLLLLAALLWAHLA